MKIIRLKEVLDCTGLSRTSVYMFMAEGRFPQSVPLGARSVGWLESEVQEWIAKRVKERDEGPYQA